MSGPRRSVCPPSTPSTWPVTQVDPGPHRYRIASAMSSTVPTREMGILEAPRANEEPAVMKGARCRECGNYTVIRKDGCDFCSACGWVGVCG